MRAAGQPTSDNSTSNNNNQPTNQQQDKPNILGLTIKDDFNPGDLIESKIIKTPEDRQQEIKKEFMKFKTTITRHLKKAIEYNNRIKQNQTYEVETELKLSIEMEAADTALQEILNDLEDDPDKLNEENINKLYNNFDIIFNDFVLIREHYRPFISNPAKNENVEDIFILKGINFKTNKNLWLRTFNDIKKHHLFNYLINETWREINNIKDKIEDKNKSKLIQHIKQIDEEHDKLRIYLKTYKNKIIDELKAFNRKTSEELRQNGNISEEDIKENQDYFDKEAVQTALKMCDVSGDLLGGFYQLGAEITNIFNDYSRKTWDDYDDFLFSELIKIYEDLIKQINELFKTYFKK